MKTPTASTFTRSTKTSAAIAAHREAPHFVKWRDTTKDWLAKPYSRTLGTNVYPSDENWR